METEAQGANKGVLSRQLGNYEFIGPLALMEAVIPQGERPVGKLWL